MAALKTQETITIPHPMAVLLARTRVMTTLVLEGHCVKDICGMLDSNPALIEEELKRVLEEHRKVPT